jgi:hypothetical protein
MQFKNFYPREGVSVDDGVGGEQQGDGLQHFDLLDAGLHEKPEGVGDVGGALVVHHLLGDEPLHHAHRQPHHPHVLGLAGLLHREQDLVHHVEHRRLRVGARIPQLDNALLTRLQN